MAKRKQDMQDEVKVSEKEHIGGKNNAISDEEPGAEQNGRDDNVADETTDGCDNSADEAASEWKDKYLRMAAEFDNYRKRTLREKADLIALGGEDVIKSLLVIWDDLDRAVQAVEQARDIDSVKQGIVLIYNEIVGLLQGKGVSEIPALGLPFDTDLHEAVAKTPVEDKDRKGKIVDVIQKGYKLKDKVVRYAKVVVGE